MNMKVKTIQEIRREFIELLKKYNALKFYRENFIQQRKNQFDNILIPMLNNKKENLEER